MRREKTEWTLARKRSFIISSLRKARWPAKFECIRKAYVKDGVNPATGKKCKLHQCVECERLFPKYMIQADHIDPVIGKDGFQSWDLYVERMFCEEDGFQALCKECHSIKTLMERFKITLEEVPGFRKLVEFKKMNAEAQCQALGEKLAKGANNQKKRINAFRRKLGIPEGKPATKRK